jgi:hypothetical protein
MTQYYSCDSHVVEPPVVFAGLEQRFGSRAPRLVQHPTGKAPDIPRSNLSVLNLKPAGSVMSCSASTMPPTGRAARPRQTSPWNPARIFDASFMPPLKTTPLAC